MSQRGFFITLEGPEGSGKSSQARWLARALRRSGYAVTYLRDPGWSDHAELTRSGL